MIPVEATLGWPYCNPTAEETKYLLQDEKGKLYDHTGKGSNSPIGLDFWPDAKSADASRMSLSYPKEYKVVAVTVKYTIYDPSVNYAPMIPQPGFGI